MYYLMIAIFVLGYAAIAFEHQLRNSLISIIQVNNVPSQKTALKNGMHLDKTTTYKNNRVHIFRVLKNKTV